MRSVLDSVSSRMILIILLSSAPLAVLSSAMSWHSYEVTSDASALRGKALTSLLQGRMQQSLSESRDFLANVASLPALQNVEACPSLLSVVLATQRQRYRSLSVLGPDGRISCTTGAKEDTLLMPSAETPPVAGIETVMVRPEPDAAGLMFAELASRIPAAPSHLLVADTRLGWNHAALFGLHGDAGLLGGPQGARAWLLGPHGLVAPACTDCGWKRPADLQRTAELAASGHGSSVATPDGAAAYATLAGPVSVLTITRPTEQEIHALSVFIIRVIGIALLLGLGLLGVTFGANMLVVAPVQRLTSAVRQWRRAGGYDPDANRLMPLELRELSHAFHQATRSLAAHENGLREAEDRQELLIKEIHHRVKNNLQIVASLLNLQANRIRVPEARAEFASARDRVRALATLHRYLYSEGDLQTLNMRSFLQELGGQLFQAIGEKQGSRIGLHIEAPEIAMATDQAVPLALVVTEAISNAVKYAFPGGRSGQVRVSLRELGEGMARLVVEDDGVGIPAGRTDTETGVRDGLGIQLIRGFSRQLGAQLDVREDSGTRYILTFPLRPREADAPSDQDADSEAASEDAGWA